MLSKCGLAFTEMCCHACVLPELKTLGLLTEFLHNIFWAPQEWGMFFMHALNLSIAVVLAAQ